MPNAQLQPVLDRIDADLDDSLERLFSLLRIKSISGDPAFADDCKAAADHLAKDIATLGFATEVRPTAGHPAIVAKSNGNGGAPHVLFYGHYDVQPVDPLNLWHRPPFEPVITDHADGRKIIVARGAEDDKGQLMTFIEACRAWKAVTGSLPLDITILIEGEEEIGSKNFVPFLEATKHELKADFALVCDTSMWDPETPAITTALRGLLYEEVKIKAASRDLHSGVFGGGAQIRSGCSPAFSAACMTRTAISPFPESRRCEGLAAGHSRAMEEARSHQFLTSIGLSIPAGETDRLLIEQVTSRPTCDINGIIGGYTGEGSKTVIPAEASAKVSFRLVEGRRPDRIRDAFRAFVRAGVPGDCKVEFIDHSSAPAIALDWNMKPLAAAKAGADRRVGQARSPDRFGRLDPDRCRFQDDARARLAAGRLRPRRRQYSLAERKIRPQELPQGHSLLGAHSRGARGIAALRRARHRRSDVMSFREGESGHWLDLELALEGPIAWRGDARSVEHDVAAVIAWPRTWHSVVRLSVPADRPEQFLKILENDCADFGGRYRTSEEEDPCT